MSLAKNIVIYMNGVDVAPALSSFNAETSANEEDVTALSGSSRSYETGFKAASAQGSGFFRFDMTLLNKIYNIQRALYVNQSTAVLTYSLGTVAVGEVAVLMDVCETGFDIPMNAGAVIRTNLTLRSTNGLNPGKWLFSAAVSSTTTNGTAVDNAAASTNGGVFHAQAQNPSELAGNVKLQHSTDNSVWVDLATLTLTGTGATYEGLSTEVAAGTTVNRYIRARATATSGIITFQAAFARR